MFQLVERENETTGEPEKQRVLTGFGIGNVFDVRQTDGPPLSHRSCRRTSSARPMSPGSWTGASVAS